jgi:Xaa-Pro aminopeptidase
LYCNNLPFWGDYFKGMAIFTCHLYKKHKIMFAKETYTTHRNSLKKRGDRFLAILDNGESGDYADNTYHFRQDSTSLYFWDLPYAGLAIWISYCMDGIQPALCEKA